jgi:hypothetical protein
LYKRLNASFWEAEGDECAVDERRERCATRKLLDYVCDGGAEAQMIKTGY